MSRYLPALFFCLLSWSLLSSAQVTTGTISGVVQDPTGALMLGVSITIKNLDTGVTRTATTDEGGRYTAPNLSLGNYEVQAEQTGFATEARRGITLTVGREAVINITLQVGNVSQTLTVTAEAPLVESTTSSMGSLVDDRTVRELPLNGRSYDRLALFQPGVVGLGAGTSQQSFDYGAGLRFSVSGSRSYANSFLLDGTDINDHANGTPGGAAGNNLGVDGIREFKIITNTFSAEYGRASGGVISAITRGGTNQLHGTAFEFFRNSALDARNFFDVAGVPPFRRNQFGGALGGPIKKDKTFFFGTYEGLRQGLGTTAIAFVPTVAAKQGILPGRVVPVNPAVKPFLALYPDPNFLDFGDGTAEFVSSPTVVTNENYFMTRVDHQINEKMSIFGRYSYDADSFLNPTQYALPVFQIISPSHRQYATVQANNVLSPTVLNSFRFAYNRSNQSIDNLPAKALGPEYSFIPGQTFGTIQVGASVAAGVSRSLATLGVDNGTPRSFTYNLFEADDDTTFVKGRHSIKAGVSIKRIRDNVAYNSSVRGVYTFNDLITLLAGTPSLLEAPQVGQDAYRGYRQSLLGVYVQDDFKITQRLTLNLGLRWEGITSPAESNGKMSNLLSTSDTKLTVMKDSYFSIAKKDFEPRVGLAWQLNGRGTTVLRAGFGIFHDHILPAAYAGFISQIPPFYNLYNAPNPSFPNGYLTLGQATTRLSIFPLNIKEPAKNSYNLSLQQQFLKDTVLEVAFIGSESHHLQGPVEQNTPVPTFVNGQPYFASGLSRANPQFASIREFLFNLNANYNALQITVRRKSSSGFQYQAFYTYSKSIDEKSSLTNGDTGQEAGAALDPLNLRRDRGLSTFNAMHNFVFTASYPFPFRFQQKAVGFLLGGWAINGMGTFRSGAPFSVRVGFNRSRNLDSQSPDRPDLVPGRSNSPVLGGPNQYYDPTAFALPVAGTYGNVGRNTVIGPGLMNLDVSLQKIFKPRESFNVQFRAELFNILNHANFALPKSTIFSSSGAYIGSAGSIVATTTSSRQIQLGLKIIF